MVWKVLDRASAAGLGLADLDALDDRELEQRVLGKRVEPKRQHALPDFTRAGHVSTSCPVPP